MTAVRMRKIMASALCAKIVNVPFEICREVFSEVISPTFR